MQSCSTCGSPAGPALHAVTWACRFSIACWQAALLVMSSSPAGHVLCCTTALCSQVGLGWKGFCTASFTTAMAVVMAELVRQVEVHCSERAQAIAQAWNMYTAAMDTCCSECPDTFAHKEKQRLTHHQTRLWTMHGANRLTGASCYLLLPCVMPHSYGARLRFALIGL